MTIKRWQAKCSVPNCQHGVTDLSTSHKNPVDTDSRNVLRNMLNHMIIHLPEGWSPDPKATRDVATCTECGKVCNGGKFPAQRNIWMHISGAHPEKAMGYMTTAGLPEPVLTPIEFNAETFDTDLRDAILAEGKSIEKHRKLSRRKQRGGDERAKQSKREYMQRKRAKDRAAAQAAPTSPTRELPDQTPEPAPVAPTRAVPPAIGRHAPPQPALPANRFRTYQEDMMSDKRDATEPGKPVEEEPKASPPEPSPAKGKKAEEEFTDEAIMDLFRSERVAHSHADDEGEGGDDEERGGGEDDRGYSGASAWGRSRYRDAELIPSGGREGDEEGEDGHPARTKRDGATMGNTGKMAIVAVLGLALLGVGALVWRRMRSKAQPTRVPMGDLLYGGQGAAPQPHPAATPTSASPPSAPTSAPRPHDHETVEIPQPESGIHTIPGRGAVGSEFRDRAGKFL